MLRQSRHQRDALRRGARPRTGHALRALPVRGRRDRRGRWLRADGGEAAITLLHGGPGLGNGLANLHNVRRAQTPVLNVVGDQATHHRPLDPPLTADTEGWARGLSAWTRVAQSVATIGADAAAAVQAARTAHGQIATLIAPADTCWDDGGIEGTPLPVPAGRPGCPACRPADRAGSPQR